MPELTRYRLKQLILSGQVADNVADNVNVIRDPARKVREGQTFVVIVPNPGDATPKAQAIPLDIRFEDAHLIVIDKPAGLVVHPAPGNPDGTLVNALLAHCGDSLAGIGGVRRPGIVHPPPKGTRRPFCVSPKPRGAPPPLRAFCSHPAAFALISP